MRRLVLMLAVSGSILLSGVAVASVMASSRQSPKPTSDDRSDRREAVEDASVHGGSIARFHGSRCSLTNVSAFQGNWTHGDYVSAEAATGDSALIVQAAQSDCGKPMVAVNHGVSPIGGLPSEAAPQAKDHALPHEGAGTPGGSPGS
jgi:hypothetical protein